MIVPVALAGWEVECCVPPPAIGDEVEWPLTWRAVDEEPGACSPAWQAVPIGLGAAAELGAAAGLGAAADLGAALQVGAVHAWCPVRRLADVPDPGRLVAGLHTDPPDEVAATRGTVRRVQVVSQVHRERRRRDWHPVPGLFALRDVARSPRWFAAGPPRSSAQLTTDKGLLLALEV